MVKTGNNYKLRWFTPKVEIDLCGHATLAAAYLLFDILKNENTQIDFHTLSGILQIHRQEKHIMMDFPARPPKTLTIQDDFINIFNIQPTEARAARDLFLIFDTEEMICTIRPDLEACRKLNQFFCITATAPGNGETDFVSRVFAPNAGIDEDPVTGSVHASLTPYWSRRLKKKSLQAKQLSSRGGTLYCEDHDHRVLIGGDASLQNKSCIEI